MAKRAGGCPRRKQLDLIVVDLMLPRLSGLDLIRELRQRRADLPILVLSAKDQEADKVMALSLGADDYMTKPFGLAELLARVRALLRRGRLNKPLASSPGSKDGSRIYLDVPGRRLLVEGEDIETTAKEFDLLRLFMSHPGQVLTRDQIMQRLWGGEHFTLRTIDNFIVRLRSKIEENADTPVHSGDCARGRISLQSVTRCQSCKIAAELWQH
jgi:DNA-binding response OmpR family regulator